jgi:hypothetical protein
MREDVERDLGDFYANSGRTKEGLACYRSLGKNFTVYLISMAENLKSKGKYTEAEKLLNAAEKYENNRNNLSDIYIQKLELYERFGKDAKHLTTAQKMLALYKRGELSQAGNEKLLYHAKKQAALLQKKVASKTYRRVKKSRNIHARRALAYFDIVSTLEKKGNEENIFHQAETLFANRSYNEAMGYYQRAFQVAQSKRNNKIVKLSLEGMLATLGKRGLRNKDKYYSNVYSSYLSYDNKSSRAKSIYQKLFNFHFEKKAVHLSFGQRIGAFLLDRVLGRHNQERTLQCKGLITDGHSLFLHDIQQG